MVGNAVPPRLACFLAKQFIKAFDKDPASKHQSSAYTSSLDKTTKIIKVKDLSNIYPDNIVSNKPIVSENQDSVIRGGVPVDTSKNVLLSLVREDTIAYYSELLLSDKNRN